MSTMISQAGFFARRLHRHSHSRVYQPQRASSRERLVFSFARVVAWAALFLFLALNANAQPRTSLLWSFQANGNMQCIAAAPDLDADGGPDVVFEGYENGPSGVDHVFAIRGASSGVGAVIWSARPIGGASSGGGWGDNCLRICPDFNSDGVADVLLGTAWGGSTAYGMDGTAGTTMWSFDTYLMSPPSPPESGWVYAIDALGSDLTMDGVSEVVFGCGSNNDYLYCVNGSTGARVWSYDGTDAFFNVLSRDDVNGDGVRDVVASLGDNTPVSPRIVTFSGANGGVLWFRPVANTAWNLAIIGDVTGDGIADVVPSQLGGNLYCLDGANGSVFWQVSASSQQRVVALDDVNGDGYMDVAAGSYQASNARAYSGRTGALLWTAPTSDWTWAIDRIADCTGDGVNDVVAGDFDGIVHLINGVSGAIEWSWTNPTGDKIKTIRGVGDLNGNGAPDVVAGTQLLYGGSGGDVYALEGNENLSAIGEGVPGRFWLSQARPNPSRGPVCWELSTSSAERVRLLVVGPDGRTVRDLGERQCEGAGQPLLWDGRDSEGVLVPTGVYYLRLLTGVRTASEGKVVVVR
ncbi:MAG: PQQ-binding-like beta-propeller repeat protein [Candidatus Eisenbacteria bacterium]|nr:PQQ-binding-like beta-propeller repeat protein [Candidatus Eisenbacteria bacterium]